MMEWPSRRGSLNSNFIGGGPRCLRGGSVEIQAQDMVKLAYRLEASKSASRIVDTWAINELDDVGHFECSSLVKMCIGEALLH